ncbi:Uncharacterised protein [Enterobacter cloacae]|uniref:Uncharacterized protein n=1 Tax=Enterobacter cloacae TaxID=550 RepID=A0A377LMU9_ENTCL|nr:Uncharacterised protein [Enterobacter cloacae]
MKLNRITASLITVMTSHMLAQPAFADRIIQRPSGAFYIVSDQEASQVFDRNNFGFFALPPSVNYQPIKAQVREPQKNEQREPSLLNRLCNALRLNVQLCQLNLSRQLNPQNQSSYVWRIRNNEF